MDYDMSFRPDTYWDIDALLANIKGQARRELIREMGRIQRIEDLPPSFFSNATGSRRRSDSDTERPAYAKMYAMSQSFRGAGPHPSLLGGEFLEDCRDNEVEICRIIWMSMGVDVLSLRARWTGRTIRYRWCDEWDVEFDLHQKWSKWPLTFGQLVDQIDNSRSQDKVGDDHGPGLTTCYLEDMVCNGADPESMRGFVRVESEFYPGITQWYEEDFDRWLASLKDEDEDDVEEE